MIEVAPDSPFSKAIDNSSLTICNWQLSKSGSGTQLQMTDFQWPIGNQRFRTLSRFDTALVERALAKPAVILPQTA
jgi:hypothetical protein